jgi:hypothetical protein
VARMQQRDWVNHSQRRIRSKSWEKVTGLYITKGALDTRWCHYQTLAPTQEGEKPAPEEKNDREKGQNGHANTSGKHRNSGSRSNMKTPLKMQEKMGNAWVLVSRNVWPPHTPPCTATIDGGSTELHPRDPTPPKDPLTFGIS